MLPLQGDEEQVKSEPKETAAERVKRNCWKKQKTGTGLKILTPNKLLAKIKAGDNSYKLKNEIRQILYLLYQHNKITQKVYDNLIK